jgi:anti-sigma-K factor RskA
MADFRADHERWRDTSGAYLLGALDDAERAAYEEHLLACPECREEVDELAPAVGALPMSVEPLAPPPALKARIMAEVEREAALLAAAGPEADRPSAPAPRRRARGWGWLVRPAPVAVVAAALLLGLVAGLGGAKLLGGGGGRTVTASVDAARAPGARVQVEVDDGRAVLVAHGLPAPPRARVYEVWLKRPGRAPEPTSALFTPSRDGTATATVPGPLGDVEQVMVTDEPLGGSRVPTRTPLVVARIS